MSIQLPITLPPLSIWQQSEKLVIESAPLASAPPPYTNEELLDAFKEWGTPEEGQKYIIRSRMNAPTRKVQGHARNVVTHYSSRKMKRRLATESRNVEFPAVLRYDLDGNTREIHCQPMQVGILMTIKRTSSRGKVTEYTTEIPYTPDILRLSNAGPFAEEWKTEEKLQVLAKRYPERFYKAESDATWHCPEREKYFSEMGITYCLRSSAEHNPTFTSNLEHLTDYLFDCGDPLSDDAWSAIEHIVSKKGAISLESLYKEAFDDETPWNELLLAPTPRGRFRIDDVLKAIAKQLLWVDLDFDDLSDPHNVVVCSSREQLEAVKWNRLPSHAVTTYVVFNVKVGSEFMFRDQPDVYTVAAMPTGKVLYHDSLSRVFEELSETQFESLIYRGDLQILSAPQTTEELLAKYEHISDKRIRIAVERKTLVERLKTARKRGESIVLPRHIRSVQRYMRAERDAGDSRPMQVQALIPRRPGGRGRQITEETLCLIREVVELGNNPTNPLTGNLYQSFLTLALERGVRRCSKGTFYRHARKFVDIRAREGARQEYNQEPAQWYLLREDKIHGGRPFHRVHIDHTKVDIIVKIRGVGGRLYRARPWLTIIMDAETRAVLGFYLSLHAPSTVSCMMAIRSMVSIHKRMPQFILVDNGKEFHSIAFDNLCDLNDATLEYRPAHESRFGAVIERLFGITNSLLIHNLIGNTAAMRHVRTVTREIDPAHADHLSFAQLHGLLEYFFFVEYNRQRRHPAHDHTPEEYMHKRFIQTGRRLTRIRPYDERFMIQTCIPVSRGGTRVFDAQRGIRIGPLYYWPDDPSEPGDRSYRYGHGPFPVLIDMWDVSIAYACIDGHNWIRFVSKLLMRYRQLTSIELRYALYEVRLRLRAAPDDTFESVLDDVLADHYLPPIADATGATRRIYGESRLAALSDRPKGEAFGINDKGPSQDEAAHSSSERVVNVTEPQAEPPSETNDSDNSLVRRFNVEYEKLPVYRPI
ncbi:putative transposase [Paraburkholderia youngii]|uniref:DDE-type integrase/transposase/recombinase n=1 Tax=Paraburkholderia youngii TaxID=2782701 RepID=UPI003D1FADC1